MNPFSLEGKHILVTGASSGIGRGIAIACAGMGASVVLTGRNENRLKETLSMMEAGDHAIIPADITKQEDRDRLVSELPKLDGMVQCAGVGSRVPCKQIAQEDINYVFQPNFEAPVLLQSAILARKKINKGASIVYIASRTAEIPTLGNAIYSASKGAIISYTKCLALELASRQIRVNCICPAMVWTDFIMQDVVDRDSLEKLQEEYPLKRYGQPEDVANLAVYMLSNASAWMTGTSVDITGGTIGV